MPKYHNYSGLWVSWITFFKYQMNIFYICQKIFRIGKFACTSGTCINDFLLCDGPEDCNDGSDETILQCGQTTCPDLSFRCLYGACIDGDKRCNDKIDCADSSDESFETCGRDLSPSTPITRLMNDSNISRYFFFLLK